MSILRRGQSRFWYIQFQFKGKTYIKSTKTTDRQMAAQMEGAWKKQLMTEEVLGIKNRLPLLESVQMYMDSKQALASIKNIKRYVAMIIKFFIRKHYVDQLTTADIENLRADMVRNGYSSQTVKHVIGTVRGFWRHSRRMGYQVSDLEFPNIPTRAGKLRYLSAEEEERFLVAIDPIRKIKGLPSYEYRTERMKAEMHDLHDFFVMLLDTGARYNEVATLRWSQIDLASEAIALWRSKVQNESILYMTARVREILLRRQKSMGGEFVFQNRAGNARGYNPSSIRRVFKRAGLPDCSPHTLRHTHATKLIQNGMSIYEVKEILGHSDIRTTMRYAHLEKEAVFRKAREVIESIGNQSLKK